MQVFIFIIVLSILVLVHELGHFVMARRAGVWVEEFGFGIPPRLFGKKIGETIYSINLFPFGGFVRLHGENPADKASKPKRAFSNLNKRKKTGIIIAGVVMNMLLAVLAFAVFYSFSGFPKDFKQVEVVGVAPDSPAMTSGIMEGDIVLTINSQKVQSVNDFITLIDKNLGSVVTIEMRDTSSQIKEVTLTPRTDPPEDQGAVGVVIAPKVGIYFPPIWQRPFLGIYFGLKDSWYWGKTIVTGIATLFVQLFAGHVPQDISGPVGIYAITVQAASYGILALVNFVGILSLNLAVLNILPLPALDGGRLLFIGIEALTKKKLSPKIEGWVHTVGMAVLLAILLAVTIGDVRKLIQFGGVKGFIDSIGK